MPQIPIMSGIATSETAEIRQNYPINLEPVVIDSGLSDSYLRSPQGAVQLTTGNPGIVRGSIVWNDVLYMVAGSKIGSVSSSGAFTVLGDVGDDGLPVSLDYSFDYLSIGSASGLYYWDRINGVRHVTDIDLGVVKDHIYVAGYNMTTDGSSLVVTELNDPMAVDPLKYGSSETDPDPITGLVLVRREVYALNRYTIDIFENVGGNGFPFALNTGASIPKGCVGRRAKCLFADTFAMVGSGRGEALSVYQAGAGQVVKIGSEEIDRLLSLEANPELIVCERIVEGDEQRLYVHLSDKTLIFYALASIKMKIPVWSIRQRGVALSGAPRPRFFALAYNKWFCGDTASTAIGYLSGSVMSDFGEINGWQFQTVLIYNESRGGIIHELELVCLPGRGADGVVFFSRSLDGELFGEEMFTANGPERTQRVVVRPHWRMSNYMAIRLRGADNSLAGIARLEAQIEGLAV
jgi:Phage stabilisation protein